MPLSLFEHYHRRATTTLNVCTPFSWDREYQFSLYILLFFSFINNETLCGSLGQVTADPASPSLRLVGFGYFRVYLSNLHQSPSFIQ